jgi:hypothetical protein
MVMASWFAALCIFGIGNCIVSTGAPTGERELRPPESGIRLGSLYYVREKPTEDISKPATLIKLCTTRLERYGITPETHRVADIDLLDQIDASAGLEGIKYEFVQLGLSGSLGDYYTYTLRNVVRTDISKVEADRILDTRGRESDCAGWRESMRGLNWGIYQISGISVGDIHFARNTSVGFGADVAAKIVKFEPKLKAAIKKSTGLTFSGKNLVVSFQPILRN